MLQPKRTKYRKMGRGRRKGTAVTGSSVHFGEFGLKAMACDWISARQIESARIAITRHLQRGGQVWIRVFPDKPISKKPAEVLEGGRLFPDKVETFRREAPKVGRNDPCPCGSGKKFKKCCGKAA